LEHLFGILVGIVVGTVVLRGWRRARNKSSPGGTVTKAPAANAEVLAPASLSERLHALESEFASFAHDSAHPRELVDHAPFKRTVDLLADPAVSLETVLQYAQGVNWLLACAALAALRWRADNARALDQVLAHFDKLPPWPLYFALEYFLSLNPRPPVGAPLAVAKDWWGDSPILPTIFRDYLARRASLGDEADFGTALQGASASPPAVIKQFLQSINLPLARALAVQLEDFERGSIDRTFLTSFGRFWADKSEPALLIEPDNWRQALTTAQAAVTQTPIRSLMVSGEPLVGKSTFLRLTAAALAPTGWSVFEASGADLMAGQQWFGQLEGRIRHVLEQLTVAKKLIWYIPDLLQLAQSGTHQGQSASILDQILPAVIAGRLVVWTEATPAGVARLLQLRPALRGVLELVRLEAQSEADTLALAQGLVRRLRENFALDIDLQCADVAVSSARQYLSAGSFPGSALQLLKLAVIRAEADAAAISPHDVLNTLSQLTGLPISILDNRERIDLASIRAFFASRVIGQDEAIDCVVERIAMLKAGLNDPHRPIGVFLFAGPTGTGKTELAKTAAAYLFGSADRLIRLDMSEFQTAESTTGILGGGPAGQTATLTSHVRKQPFSVVLLDEFEKAHPLVWDLFLQVFDDARLTDAAGQVANFRHCLIIMTTNLGATSHQTMGLGFAPGAAVFTTEQVMKAIRQTYRPEFQNRIDRIIVFRPLTRELMRVILHKELSDVLERRGLKDRAWAVEWEASALEFLLEKGFSPEMGARPLKRAIEQYVMAPLAATIVEKRFPEGDQFVFFRSDGRAIQAEFVDPDSDPLPPSVAPEVATAGSTPTLASMILSPRGTGDELKALVDAAEGIEQTLHAAAWENLKRRLAGEMSAPGFWQRADRHDSLARLALMDRVAAAAETAAALRGRLERGTTRTGQSSRELIARLALQLHLVREGIKDVEQAAAIEVALVAEPALTAMAGDTATIAAWCRELLDMYRGWAASRHMQVSEIKYDSAVGLPILLVSGFGAHRLLSRECGLHVLELADSGNGANRATARVRLAVAPLGDVPAAKLPGALIEALDKAPAASAVVRRYRREPAPLVRNADGSWRTGRLDAVLRGDFDLLAADDG
jgi:ATP-dependent Clp protease ATP-binding subunit ClpC